MKWTDDQQKAIDGREGTLLVSAAAGSGKTAVLVERVIRRICDAEKPCGIENLLIVTFTNAAATQMREKIQAAIAKKIAENPSDRQLRRQQLMLPCANICTIDSFCISLVRENFHALGIAPDFGLLDEGKLGILRGKAVNSVVDSLYENPSGSFLQLCELISDTRDDKKLVDAILKLYSLSRAYPFPERWLLSLAEEFENPCSAEDSQWGRIIINYAIELVCSCISDVDYCISLLASEPELEAKYRPAFENDRAQLERLLDLLSDGGWDDIVKACAEIAFVKMAAAPRGYESAVKEICKSTRDAYKKRIDGLSKTMCVSSAEHREDIEMLAPIIRELVNAVLKFGEEFSALKAEENGADFSDTLHLALKLLVEPTESGYERTPLAVALSENYAEILVDEYQDVNKAQDMIFSAVSRSESNLFMVGDVKQSIYRFRQAMPEIFLARRNSLSEFDGCNYPAKVTLGKNFRSRSGVTETVNFIFSALMSRDAGGLDYDKNEYLEAAAPYPEHSQADAKVCLIETEKDDFLAAQARYAADYIKNAVESGATFTSGGSLKKAGYGDFCILLRSVKNSSAPFVAEFNARGIPVCCEAGDGFLSSPEIMFMISLLKIIDNPADDIPLTAVMLSPSFGFEPDELARMRANLRKGNVYQCLTFAAENGNLKAANFLEEIRSMRHIAVTVGAGELVRRLIEETGCGATVGAMKDSGRRRKNLNAFIDLANKYESFGQKGVSGFVRYLDGITENGGDAAQAGSDPDSSDCVKIMTIHKSKGLEFPVCFIGACEKKYGDLSLKEDLLIASESGIGIRACKGTVQYDTLPRIAAAIETKRAEHSEELRILYVALTRAKEKLIMLASAQDWGKELSKLAAGIRKEELINPFTVVNFHSYAECILSALIRHPDAHSLRNSAGISASAALPCSARLEAEIISASESPQSREKPEQAEADAAVLEEIRKRAAYVYPYSALDGIVSKRIASKLGEEEANGEFFASRRPSFIGREGMTPAQIGTATHRFMQYADYKKARENVGAELKRLVEQGMLTEAESRVVDKKAVSAFFSGSLAHRIINAERVYKEYAFTAAVPLAEMEPSVPESEAGGESIIIEGVADCAFVEDGELVIVDFKTDKATNPDELAEKYREQLSIYRRCLAEVIGIPVKQTVIYSFKLGEIEV